MFLHPIRVIKIYLIVKALLLFLLLPFTAFAQQVDPVVSKDYLDLINKNPQFRVFLVDTSNSASNSFLKLSNTYIGNSIKKIKVHNGHLKIEPARYKFFSVTGAFNSTVEIKKINQLPALQTQYVQGRNENGNLTWHGPETNELFSYGPSINTLEFDGSNYAYDVNGRLVSKGTGNGNPARVYNNSIFRTASFLSQSLMTQFKYKVASIEYLMKVKFVHSDENTIIRSINNSTQNFSSSLEIPVKWLTISSTYSSSSIRSSNSNRNGFLNRAYQNAILTPISFDTHQGTNIGNTQRTYSNGADNPYFLLEDNDNSSSQSDKIATLSFEKKQRPLKFKIFQSIENSSENSNEGYKPGSVSFPNGITITRRKKDQNYFLNTNSAYDIKYGNYKFESTATINYIYNDASAIIDYSVKSYHYQRSSHDLAANYETTYRGYHFQSSIKLGNKFYASNTALSKDLFLPDVFGYIQFYSLYNYFNIKLASSYNQFNSELPVNSSFSQYGLVNYTAQQSSQFFPVTEISGFDNLGSIHQKEWEARIEANYKNKLSLIAEVFNRRINDDIFPVFENGILDLKNLVTHQKNGFEAQLTHNLYLKKIAFTNSVLFSKYKDQVIDVKQGFNFTPLTGFSDVHKAIVKGESLGVIVGNKFLRNANSNIVIGSDGFPLVDPSVSVIGDPTPDFTVKLNNTVTWKALELHVDWEWRKGGVMWNGTQAVLDYYGRSQTSAFLRTTSGYVFPGDQQNGSANKTAVKFYDLNSPLENNRWVRYGYTGVAEEYIQKGDYLRINDLGLSYKLNIKKYFQNITFSLYAYNLILWTAYKGADPNQLLFDQPNSNGLDFFNLTSSKKLGLTISLQF